MNGLLTKARQLHDLLFALVSYAQTPFLLFVRLYWGWQLAQSGWGKLHNLDKVAEFFTSLNLPAPGEMAVFIACVELFGAIFFANHLFGSHRELDHGLCNRGPRGSFVDLFRSGQIHSGGPLQLPFCCAACADFWSRQGIGR